MGSCFGHITNFHGNTNRNPVMHITTYNSRSNEVELKCLLEEPQYINGSAPARPATTDASLLQRACSLLSWEHVKTSQRRWQKLVLNNNETIDLRDLKPEFKHSKDTVLTLDAKQLFKMKTGLTAGHYLTLNSPPSSIDLEWENEGLSATSCVQSDYTTTLATISSDGHSCDLSNNSSIESLEWDLGLNNYTKSHLDAKCVVAQIENLTLQALKESSPDR